MVVLWNLPWWSINGRYFTFRGRWWKNFRVRRDPSTRHKLATFPHADLTGAHQPSLRYSTVVIQAVGVICRTCGSALEIEDAYIPAVHAAEMAATLYPGFGRARALERADLSTGWAKTLTCGNCGQTHDSQGNSRAPRWTNALLVLRSTDIPPTNVAGSLTALYRCPPSETSAPSGLSPRSVASPSSRMIAPPPESKMNRAFLRPPSGLLKLRVAMGALPSTDKGTVT